MPHSVGIFSLRSFRDVALKVIFSLQRVIDSLEDEKEALTLAMADRLREYQDLVQVKTGLSLEVATYR